MQSATGVIERGKGRMYRKDGTHESAIDKTSYVMGEDRVWHERVNKGAAFLTIVMPTTSWTGLECSKGRRFRRDISLPVRRYLDSIVSGKAKKGPVYSEICAGQSHGSEGDESWEEGECNMNIGKHLISG